MLHIGSPQLREAHGSPASWKTSSSGLTYSSSQNTNRQAAVMHQLVHNDHLDALGGPSLDTPNSAAAYVPRLAGYSSPPEPCSNSSSGTTQSTCYRANVASTESKSFGNRKPGHIWQVSAWRFDALGYCSFQSRQTARLNTLLHVAGAGFGLPCTLCSPIHATSSV